MRRKERRMTKRKRCRVRKERRRSCKEALKEKTNNRGEGEDGEVGGLGKS